MVVCKITINKEPDLEYNKVFNKIMELGDFLISGDNQYYEVYFASEKEEVTEEYIRKILRKGKLNALVHSYGEKDVLDLDSYTNQWVLNNLDKQMKILIEREQQPVLQQIDRRLVLLDRLADEMINVINTNKQSEEEKDQEKRTQNNVNNTNNKQTEIQNN